MYIINPTQEQFDSWFSCNKTMGEYLIQELGAVPIHRKKNRDYFVSTVSFKEKLKKVPVYIRLLNKL